MKRILFTVIMACTLAANAHATTMVGGDTPRMPRFTDHATEFEHWQHDKEMARRAKQKRRNETKKACAEKPQVCKRRMR